MRSGDARGGAQNAEMAKMKKNKNVRRRRVGPGRSWCFDVGREAKLGWRPLASNEGSMVGQPGASGRTSGGLFCFRVGSAKAVTPGPRERCESCSTQGWSGNGPGQPIFRVCTRRRRTGHVPRFSTFVSWAGSASRAEGSQACPALDARCLDRLSDTRVDIPHLDPHGTAAGGVRTSRVPCPIRLRMT